MQDLYDHSAQSKQTQCRANKQHPEPYFEYDPNPEALNKRKIVVHSPKKEPDAIVVHKLSFVVNFTFLSVGLYFLAKLLFLLYNAGDSVECLLQYPV